MRFSFFRFPPNGRSVNRSASSILFVLSSGESVTAELYDHDQGPGGTAPQHGRQGGTSRPRTEKGTFVRTKVLGTFDHACLERGTVYIAPTSLRRRYFRSKKGTSYV